MNTNGIPILLVIGAVIVLTVVIARMWRTLLKWALVIGGVVVLVVGAVTFLPSIDTGETGQAIGDLADIARAVAPKPEPEPAPQPVYTTPSGGGFVASVLTALVILALGVAGYFFARWKLAEVQRARPQARPLYQPEPRHRQQLPQLPPWTVDQQYPQTPPVVYYLTGDGQEASIPDVDPSQWGW